VQKNIVRRALQTLAEFEQVLQARAAASLFKQSNGGGLESAAFGEFGLCKSALESQRSLARHIFDWGYHIQAGAYCEGFSLASGSDRTRFKFIFVTSKPPFRVAVVELPFAAIMLGADQYRAGMARFAECLERNQWPSIWDCEVELDLPEYAYTQNQ